MNGESYIVIGIMSPGFHFPDRDTELWLPLGLTPQVLGRRNSHFLKVVGRVGRGHTLQQAAADMTAVARQLEQEFPATNSRIGVMTVPLKDELLGSSRASFVILLLAAACVLLIACANVGNMLLARAADRHREISVRFALGASPVRLLRQILTENLTLALAGGLLGVLCAIWSLKALQPMVPNELVTLRIDTRVLAFSILVSALTGLLSGFAPALHLARTQLAGRGVIGTGASKLRDVLLIGELAVALVLVLGASLLIETLAKLRAVDPGFRAENVLTAEITVPFPKYRDSGERQRFYEDVLKRVRAMPGAQMAGLGSDLPFTSHGNTMSLTIEGQTAQPGLGQDVLFRLVSPGYLETIGARLRQGRMLEDRDRRDSPPVVVVSESLARQYWPGQNALGHRIDTGTGDGSRLWMTIVGVVADIRERGLDLGLKPAVYVPFTQSAIGFFVPGEIAVRTWREPMTLANDLRRAVWSVDSEQPVSHVRPMSAIVDDELSSRSRVLKMLAAFSGLALLLAALGIYGVISYFVSQRTAEIGLRMAVGATQWDIVRDIATYALRRIAIGVSCGVLLAIATTRVLSTLLFGVSPLEPRAFAIVTLGLATIALAATCVPARRASLVDPVIALRHE
jgi:putative ABC transport system permease protein